LKSTTLQAHFDLHGHTEGHVDCKRCAAALAAAVDPTQLAEFEFSQAASVWLEIHQRYISEETLLDYKKCIKALTVFFAGMVLAAVNIGNIREYQEERKHVQRVNKECVVLKMILHEAHLWKEIAPHYKPLPVRHTETGRRLTWDEEDRLKAVVRRAVDEGRKQWALAGTCLLAMANIGFGFKELKYLRRRDVDLDNKIVMLVVQAKNEERYRRVPLNQTAFEAFSYLIERWKKIGGKDDEEFLLPHRAHIAGARWNFLVPMGSIKTAHKKIMKAAKIENFRIYDCRHHAQSKWLANPKIAPEVTDAMAGHISKAMRKRYGHFLIEQMRAAVDAMETPPKKPVENSVQMKAKSMNA